MDGKMMGFIVILVAVLMTAILWLMQPHPKTDPMLKAEFIERSENYIQTLGSRSLETLTVEQKLLLLHAYYQTEKYEEALGVGDSLGEAFDRLPPERRQAFRAMLEQARAKV